MKPPTISLCLIARNEAANLPRLIISAYEAADEIVVVDTGSTDRTIAIAESLGAKVFQYAWDDNFAAAKNNALRHTTGDWVLFLDADMAIEAGSAARIRAAVKSGQARSYFLNINSPRSDGMTVETVAHPWLFENHTGLQFIGRVHESILPSLTANGLKPAATDISITHFGYAKEQDLQARAERDLRILETSDDDVYNWFYRARAYNRLGRKAEAATLLQHVLSTFDVDDRLRTNAYCLLIRLTPEVGSPAQARLLIREAVSSYPIDRMTLITAADASILLNDFNWAATYLQRALATHPYKGQGVEALNRTDPYLHQQLAECLTCLQQFGEAVHEYELAIEGGLQTADVYCSLGVTHSLMHHNQEAEASFKKASHLEPQSPEPHRQLGFFYAETGRTANAIAELKLALACGSNDLHVGQTLKQLMQTRTYEQVQA